MLNTLKFNVRLLSTATGQVANSFLPLLTMLVICSFFMYLANPVGNPATKIETLVADVIEIAEAITSDSSSEEDGWDATVPPGSTSTATQSFS